MIRRIISAISAVSALCILAIGAPAWAVPPGVSPNVATGTTASTVAAGNDPRIIGAVQAAGGNASLTTLVSDPTAALGTLAFKAAEVIDASDPQFAGGARCDGSQDDTAAFNAAGAAALTSSGYTNNGAVKIIASTGLGSKGCKVSAVNFTGFTRGGSGSALVLDDMHLTCTDSTKDCIDLLTDHYVYLGNNFSIGGSANIGLKIGNINPSVATCCILNFGSARIEGAFAFAAVLNASAETTRMLNPIIRNNGSTIGPISAINGFTFSAGSGYANGTYTAVALSGGTGAGAIVDITAAGGGVTAVYLHHQGKRYTVGDTLAPASAFGGGSGFSVTVSNISPYAYVMDGANHWNLTSDFQTVSWAPDTFYTFTQQLIVGGSIRYGDSTTMGVPLWTSYARAFTAHQLYLYSANPAAPDIELFDNNAANANTNSNSGLDLDFTPEGAASSSAIFLYGSNAGPSLRNSRIIDEADGTLNALKTDANITSVTAQNVDWSIPTLINGFLATPALWTVSGMVRVPKTVTMPGAFTGLFCTPACTVYGASSLQSFLAAPYGMAALSAPGSGSNAAAWQILGDTTATNQTLLAASNATGDIGGVNYYITRASTPSGSAAVASGDTFAWNWRGDDGGGSPGVRYGKFSCGPVGTVSSGIIPGRCFGATTDTTGTLKSSFQFGPGSDFTMLGQTRYTPSLALTAAGASYATALALTADINVVTTVAASSGVTLTAYTGLAPGTMRQEVFNRGANSLLVYPPVGAQIESLAVNTGYSLASGGHGIFECISATQCYAAP